MKKWEDLLQYSALLLFLLLLNLLAARYFWRIDLTEEKKYSIADNSKTLLKSLDEVVTVQVFLGGDLNADFKRLRKAVQETLDEFRIYGGDFIQYQFINPDEATSEKERNNFYQSLIAKGIQPTNLFDNVEGKKVQKIIFPYALISYKNKEVPVLLLKGNVAASAKEKLNQSVEAVEYELAYTIKNLTQSQKPAIALLTGHEELTADQTADMEEALTTSYLVDRVDISKDQLTGYDAIVVAQPKRKYDEAAKYKIDQFIMNGGKALFFLDAVQMNLDSIPLGGTYAFGYDLGIDDLLFRYGVRVNQDLLQDLFMGNIVVNVGRFGNAANLQPIRFPYYIALNQFANHPTVRNLNAVYARFASTIDTVKADKVKKTPLLFTNKYSRVRRVPNQITLDELKVDMQKDLYQKQYLPVLYLLEGQFSSLYKNRFAPDGSKPKIESPPTKLIVCSDGDLLRNEIDRKTKQTFPLGFDPITRQTFANKELIQNLLAYLLDEQGLINTRSKEIALRPLDELRIKEEKNYWQLLNVLLPIVLVLAFGLLRYYVRQRKHK
jgi:ABC-2 type transport system permease protein